MNLIIMIVAIFYVISRKEGYLDVLIANDFIKKIL